MSNAVFTDRQLNELRKPLEGSRVARRTDGKQSLSYLEGYDYIDTANRIIGFGMWGRTTPEVIKHTEVEKQVNGKTRYDVFVVLAGSVLVASQTGQLIPHGDVGFGSGQSYTSFGDSYEKAYKEAATDLMKRCFRDLGNQFGNSLYSKEDPLGQQTAADMVQAESIIKEQYDMIGALVGQLGWDGERAQKFLMAQTDGLANNRAQLTYDQADRVIAVLDAMVRQAKAAGSVA